ncbi:MAG: hypothetical protein AAGC96_14385 [Pseudomonadota bacterium]
MRNSVPLIIVLVLLVGGGFALMMLADAAGNRRLDNSLVGLNGLSTWLEQEDVTILRSNQRISPNPNAVGLRVLPLYDIDLAVQAEEPANRRQLMRQNTQRDLDYYIYWQKLRQGPTLVLLPKWSTGFIETAVAHEQTLIPISRFGRLLTQLGLSGIVLMREGPEFATERLGDNRSGDAALFQAQTFAVDSLPDRCRSLLGFGPGVLVIECNLEDFNHPVWFVSDPDLLNNHGLSIADNAAITAEFVTGFVPETAPQSVYMDTSPALLTDYEMIDQERVDYERSGDDLARFFEYPLSILWAIMLFVLAVLFWRGAVRFGPVLRDDGRSADRSKTVAIATKARLLRLSNSDGQMVADFVRTHLVDLTSHMFGPDAGEAGQKSFFAHLTRRDATLGKAFQDVCENLINNAANMSHPELFKALESYKTLLEKVENENGSLGLSKTR